MTFTTAVARALRQYATFSGRASRAEFWWFLLFVVLVDLGVSLLDRAVGAPALPLLATLLLFLPSLAVAVRRLHDIGKSGWWLLVFNLLPVAGAVLASVGAALGPLSGGAGGVLALVVAVGGVLVILGTLVVALAWAVTAGDRGPNRFGENPLREAPARV